MPSYNPWDKSRRSPQLVCGGSELLPDWSMKWGSLVASDNILAWSMDCRRATSFIVLFERVYSTATTTVVGLDDAWCCPSQKQKYSAWLAFRKTFPGAKSLTFWIFCDTKRIIPCNLRNIPAWLFIFPWTFFHHAQIVQSINVFLRFGAIINGKN